MSDPHTHPVDALHDAIDGRLDEHDRAALEAHLLACETCRRELALLSEMKRRFGVRMREDEAVVPADLEARLRLSLDTEDERRAQEATSGSTEAGGSGWRWIGWTAAAAAVLALTIIWSERRPGPSPPAEVAADFRRFTIETLPLDHLTGDVADLERRLSGTSLGFTARVFDFGMMDYRLTGGGQHQVAGEASALFAYAGPDSLRLLCQMYVGRVGSLPSPTERRTNDGIEFLIYRDNEVTVVFWQEGDVVCALAANGDPEAAVRLAFAKAVKV